MIYPKIGKDNNVYSCHEWNIQPIAIRNEKECCDGCGLIKPTWAIDSSGWEYSGCNLCSSCLNRLAKLL